MSIKVLFVRVNHTKKPVQTGQECHHDNRLQNDPVTLGHSRVIFPDDFILEDAFEDDKFHRKIKIEGSIDLGSRV